MSVKIRTPKPDEFTLRAATASAVVWGVLLLSLPVIPVDAQIIPPILMQEEEIPPRYGEVVRDLVERYEDLRERLRAEMRRNADLYTAVEMDAAVRDLENDLDAAYQRIGELEARLKASLVRHREAEEKTLRYKATLIKTEAGLLREIDTTQQVLDAMQVESLVQLGPTFSPAGSLGGLGIINLPGTRLSLLGGVDYDLREQEWRSVFGVTFRFLSQRGIVNSWVRMRNADSDKARLSPNRIQSIRERQRTSSPAP